MTLLKQKDITRRNDKGARNKCTYRCNWCGMVFDQDVYTISGDGKHKCSSQVVCPKCYNFIRTEVD